MSVEDDSGEALIEVAEQACRTDCWMCEPMDKCHCVGITIGLIVLLTALRQWNRRDR